ncbi:MAG: type II toxin-antitoxin system VapC family toxin [Phycisphaerae bacterium]
MRLKVYIETTIVSYLTARPSHDLIMAANQKITREWWAGPRHAYDLYISQFVLDEAGDGDPDAAQRRLAALECLPLLDVTPATMAIAEEIVRRRLLPSRAATDAYHLSVAAAGRMDFLLTWNCNHLANAELYRPIAALLRDRGIEPPQVCVPSELMGMGPKE